MFAGLNVKVWTSFLAWFEQKTVGLHSQNGMRIAIRMNRCYLHISHDTSALIWCSKCDQNCQSCFCQLGMLSNCHLSHGATCHLACWQQSCSESSVWNHCHWFPNISFPAALEGWKSNMKTRRYWNGWYSTYKWLKIWRNSGNNHVICVRFERSSD